MSAPEFRVEMGNASRALKTFAKTWKKSEKHLLLSATYGLNASCTKKIAIGLGLQSGDEFEPVIKFLSNAADGVCLGLSSWTELANALETISDYFEVPMCEDGQWYLDEIELGDCNVRFTSAHGARAIRFDVYNGSGDTAAAEEAVREGSRSAQEDGSPLLKRPKLYIPSVVMQKTTFDGLKSVFVCVDEQVRRLQRIASRVNQCKREYIKYVVSRVERLAVREPSLQVIAQIAKNEHGNVREIVNRLSEPAFIDNYLDIVLLELSRLFPNHIAVEVKQQLEVKRTPEVQRKPEVPAS